jgi:serine/threonine-protein kinase
VTEVNFGRYRVTGTLGAGGMGEVYAAVDEVLGREVAVKTLRGKHSGLAARMLDERFRQEARAIASLAHPGVVQVFDIDLAAEPPYIVMERVAGPSLKERLANTRLDAAELRALGIQISRALATAHAAGIVHRDVKPANILAATEGMWKLADFGVAHVPDSALTMTGQFVGSPAYAPPEALVRGQSGPEGDVYGLGASLYEAALGRWPRAEATTGGLLAPVPSLRELAPELPAMLTMAIDRAVAVEPESRPTAAELADALAGAESIIGVGPVALPRQASAPLSRMASAGWKRWAIGAGAALLLLIVIAVATKKSGPPAPAAGGASPPAPRTPPEPPRGSPETPRGEPVREIRAVPPRGMDQRQAKDWNKIVDKLYDQDWSEARKKVLEFERKYGELPETTSLREQLDSLPQDHED